jgi:hypothetical protein
VSAQLSPEDVVRKFFDCYTNGRPEDFDEVVAPDYLGYGHTPPGRGPGGARDDYENAVKQAGALYGIAAESLGQPRTWYGLPFGACVWAVDYAVLPAAGLYKPIQDYNRETLAKDLTAHLVYGTAAAAALRLLSPLTKHPRHG